VEGQPYIPYEKKMDLRTDSYLFIGYSERYIGFRFYCPFIKNIKMDNAKFFEDIQNSRNQLYKNFTFEEEHIIIPMTTIPNDEVVILRQNEDTVVP